MVARRVVDDAPVAAVLAEVGGPAAAGDEAHRQPLAQRPAEVGGQVEPAAGAVRVGVGDRRDDPALDVGVEAAADAMPRLGAGAAGMVPVRPLRLGVLGDDAGGDVHVSHHVVGVLRRAVEADDVLQLVAGLAVAVAPGVVVGDLGGDVEAAPCPGLRRHHRERHRLRRGRLRPGATGVGAVADAELLAAGLALLEEVALAGGEILVRRRGRGQRLPLRRRHRVGRRGPLRRLRPEARVDAHPRLEGQRLAGGAPGAG